MQDMKQKAEESREKRMQVIYKHMAAGVTFIDPFQAYIDETVTIGEGTVIGPGVILQGSTVIGSGCMVGQNSRIKDSQIGNEVQIQSSVVLESKVGDFTTIGPFAYLRPGAELGQKVKIGDFVEVKKSKVGDGSKASHLAYIGDAEVGKDVNISCGVIFCNYDGVNKYKTIVKDGAFIGSNSNLVAPVIVEKDGYVAAGTTVVKDVPEDTLCVARPAARLIPGWVSRKFGKK
jgi:bifunctional UDP-N-acetylglucosamine pyrophosphorylase/glucosamine-1-phosphate N-acetyltransferase